MNRPSAVPRVAAHRVEVGDALVGRLLERREHRVLRLLEQLLGLGRVDPAAGDDLGAGDDLARLRVDGDDHHDHALLGEVLAVAQHAVADVADDPVDVQVARPAPPGARPPCRSS